MNLHGKKIAIMGGNSGIGMAAALYAANHGADVLISGRNQKKIEQTETELEKARIDPSQEFMSMKTDIRNTEETIRALSESLRNFGGTDVLIISAGTSFPGYCESIPDREFEDQIKTNLVGAWTAAKTAFPFLKKSGGTIVFISSIAGFMGVYGYAGYSASKAGLNNLAETLRVEWKRHGINIKVLCPPDTDTPMLQKPRNPKPPETLAISGTAKTATPEFVAEKLFKCLKKRKFYIVPGIMASITWAAYRLNPGIVYRYMDRSAKKAGEISL